MAQNSTNSAWLEVDNCVILVRQITSPDIESSDRADEEIGFLCYKKFPALSIANPIFDSYVG